MTDGAWRVAGTITLFAVLGIFYLSTFSLRSIADTDLNSLQTRSFVLHGDIDLSRYGELPVSDVLYEVRDGHTYSIYGAGISLVGAPIYLPLIHLRASDEILQGAVGIIFVAAAAAILLRTLLRLTSPGLAAAAAIVFAFGTTTWTVASRAYFQQGPVVFFQCLGLTGLLSKAPAGPTLAGLGFGAATFVRPTAGIPLVLFAIVQLVEDRRAAFRYALGAAVPIIALLVQNRWIWGTWLTGSYSHQPVGFHEDLGRGAFGLLFGWWRGIFVYSPALILGFVGFFLAARRRTGFVERRMVFLGLSTIATILFYSRWDDWGGGLHQFGYRLLLEIVPFLVVLGTYAVARLRRLRFVAALLAAASVVTMTWGAAPRRDAFDTTFFASRFGDTSFARSWNAFLDDPFPGLLRMAGVVIAGLIIYALASRLASPDEAIIERTAAA